MCVWAEVGLEPQLLFPERSLCTKHLHSVARSTPSPHVGGSRIIFIHGPEGRDSPGSNSWDVVKAGGRGTPRSLARRASKGEWRSDQSPEKNEGEGGRCGRRAAQFPWALCAHLGPWMTRPWLQQGCAPLARGAHLRPRSALPTAAAVVTVKMVSHPAGLPSVCLLPHVSATRGCLYSCLSLSVFHLHASARKRGEGSGLWRGEQAK